MPIPSLTSSGFTALEDSSKFSRDPVDQGIQYHTEGGVFLSRPRNTRDPGVVFTTGWTNISAANFAKLEVFYKSVHGSSYQFTYTDPSTSETFSVRFLKPYKSTYTGVGAYKRWDINEVSMQTV